MAERRHDVELRRVYDDDALRGRGYHVLIDRLWPRGVSKADLPLDEWLKDVAPSTELRRWYGHDVDKFDEFARRYRAELREPPASDALEHLVDIASRRRLTLLTATRDVEHSAGQVLLQVLKRRSR
jgi:uncharacterized protein YeaO (DUF488 family)